MSKTVRVLMRHKPDEIIECSRVLSDTASIEIYNSDEVVAQFPWNSIDGYVVTGKKDDDGAG